MAVFRRRNDAAEPEPEPPSSPTPAPGARKDRPTPTRKAAEAARRQRVVPTVSGKQARQAASRQAREERMRAVAQRDSSPDKVLLQNYVDARFNLGEFLLPAVVVVLAITFLGSIWPSVTAITTAVMYLFILAVVVDEFLMWRGFKRVLAQRLPQASTRGLLMYGVTRSTQIRRFRVPPPRIKRGGTY